MTMNRRKGRFGGDPASRLTYTPTVSRALMRRLERAKSLTPKSQKALQDYIDVLAKAEGITT